jgi:hypothetical protein
MPFRGRRSGSGAGDIFATSFWCVSGDRRSLEATVPAPRASFVEGEGIAAVPVRAQIEERLRRNPDIIAR